MAHEITGKVMLLLPEQSGTGKNGQWLRQDFVIETEEQFPRKVCFSAWGDKVALVKSMKPGTYVKVSFNIESREFNSRWYTDLRIWKVESADTLPASGHPASEPEPLMPDESLGEPEDGLPF
jgi:hypothetical protein